jgi:formamidopyrimidine-DNA glycosylase
VPELPEVEAITEVAARFSINARITGVEIVRNNGRYFPDGLPIGCAILDVFRRGKYVMFRLNSGQYIQCHNAMSGYWDYDQHHWTFDYVEGARVATDKDVRVRIRLDNGYVLRFHDARLFGHVRLVDEPPSNTGWELIRTTFGDLTKPVMREHRFRERLLNDLRPIKVVLMDQSFLAGIGNIYSNEALHLACIDPRWPACAVPFDQAGVLLEALRCVVSLCIPQVRYDWLKVYRRSHCGSCGNFVFREKLCGRTTFSCPRCQWER